MTLLAGRYELGEPLGSGGMARVVAAHDHLLQREVAIKLVHDTLVGDPVSRERLLREARTAASLHHPNTVTVFDVGESDGYPFIVMELVHGKSLSERLRQEGALPAADVAAVASDVLAGLSAAHERGLVHRDIKPSNILLPATGGAKLVDFGIAKVLSEAATGLTSVGQVVGTPRYLAPERSAGLPASPASDLYSLGVVLYQCLAGQVPFAAEPPVAQALAHLHEPVPSLPERAPHVPAQLARVIEQALAKDPAARFADAASMQGALQAPTPDPVTVAAGSTRALPTADDTRVLLAARGRRRARQVGTGNRRWLWLAAASVVAATVVAVLLLTTGDGDPDQQTTPEADDASENTESGDAADQPDDASNGTDDGSENTDTELPDEPADVGELLAVLDADVAAIGDKGTNLVDELRKVDGEQRGGKRAEGSRDLIQKVSTWVHDGELDPEVGRQTVSLLEPVARPDDPVLADVSVLYADVAAERPRWGEKADDLLSSLHNLLKADSPDKRAERAEELAEDIREWVDDGEITPAMGERAIDPLRQAQRR